MRGRVGRSRRKGFRRGFGLAAFRRRRRAQREDRQRRSGAGELQRERDLAAAADERRAVFAGAAICRSAAAWTGWTPPAQKDSLSVDWCLLEPDAVDRPIRRLVAGDDTETEGDGGLKGPGKGPPSRSGGRNRRPPTIPRPVRRLPGPGPRGSRIPAGRPAARLTEQHFRFFGVFFFFGGVSLSAFQLAEAAAISGATSSLRVKTIGEPPPIGTAVKLAGGTDPGGAAIPTRYWSDSSLLPGRRNCFRQRCRG